MTDLLAVPVRVVDVGPADPAGFVAVRLAQEGPTIGPQALVVVVGLTSAQAEAAGIVPGAFFVAALRTP